MNETMVLPINPETGVNYLIPVRQIQTIIRELGGINMDPAMYIRNLKANQCNCEEKPVVAKKMSSEERRIYIMSLRTNKNE